MSAVGLVNAERIKLSTTRATLWIAGAVAAISLMLAALQGALASPWSSFGPENAALGVVVFGVPVLMVSASMTVTAEYRTGMIRTTFIAAPERTKVLIAKGIVTSVFSAAFAAVLAVCSVLVARLFAVPPAGAELSLSSPAVWHLAGAVALYGVLAAVLGVGVGALLRAGPGAVAVLLLWPLVVEPIMANLPDIGPRVGPYLPFANIFVFTGVPWLYPYYAMPWGAVGSLVYFAVFVAFVFVAASVVLNMRDA